MWDKIRRVVAAIGMLAIALLGWLAAHFKRKADKEERRADTAELQADIYKEAERVQQDIKKRQEEASQATSSNIDTAISEWNNGV